MVLEPQAGFAVKSIFEPHKLSSVVARRVSDPRLVNVAEFLLGSSVYVHQARVNFQAGFVGQGFSWHSDFGWYFPIWVVVVLDVLNRNLAL